MPRKRSGGAKSFRLTDYPMFFIGHIHQANFTAMQKALSAEKTNPHAWRILASLQERDGQTINDLARATVTERTYLSKIAAAMTREKLIRRATSDADKRSVRIFLTDKGYAKFRTLRPIALRRYQILLGKMPKPLQAQFMQALRIASKNLSDDPSS